MIENFFSKKTNLFFVFSLLLLFLDLGLGVVSAATLNVVPFQLGASGSATSTWSNSQSHTGSYSVNLKTTTEGDLAYVSLNSNLPDKIDDITSLSFYFNHVSYDTGPGPHLGIMVKDEGTGQHYLAVSGSTVSSIGVWYKADGITGDGLTGGVNPDEVWWYSTINADGSGYNTAGQSGPMTFNNIKSNLAGYTLLNIVVNMGIVTSPFIGTGEVYIDDIEVNGVTYYGKIQEAIDAANSGDTINVAAGTYDGFKIDGKNNLVVQSLDNAVISTNPVIQIVNTVTGPKNCEVFVDVVNSADVTIKRLTLDANGIVGADNGDGNRYFRAIYYSSSDGTIQDNTIKNIHIGGQKSQGIWIDDGEDIKILDNTINEFGKGGIVVYEASSVQIEGNTISTTDHSIAPNGIQIGYLVGGGSPALGVTGTISDNEISGCSWEDYDSNEGYDGDTWTGAGILIMDTTADLEISNNDVHDNDVGMDIEAGSSTTIQNNDIYDNIYGFVLWNENPSINYNKIYNNDEYGIFRTTMGSVTGVLNAENNWWGSNTGSKHTSTSIDCKPPSEGGWNCDLCDENPDGTGDEVSNNVDFCPWLTLDLTLTSPENNLVYNTRNILVDASTNLKADKIEYSDNDGSFRRLCSNCDSYSRKKNFGEGDHTFTVKATLGSETVSKTVNFFVDSTPPRIIKILPEDEDIIHGTTFYIKYTEANLVDISLYWKESTQSTYQKITNTSCEQGTNKECTLTFDLTGYDGKMINFYFDVRDPANTATSSVRTITIDDTDPVVTINSPEDDKKYSSRRIDLDVGVDEQVKTLEYSLDEGIRFNRLCNNCKSYKRMTNFNDGDHTLVVRATDYAGNVGQSSISFFVDSTPPRIIRQYPQDKKYTNGTFTITYTEQNLNEITLYYKGFSETEYKSSPENPCEPGTNKECVFYVDLTSYDGKQINYYFVVQNGVGETTGKIYTVNVDTKIPNIEKIYSPENGKTYYSRRVQLDIKIDEPVELEYSDNGGIKFTRLCTRCDSYNRTHTFSYGWHGLVIRATDNADNTVTKPVEFWVVKNLS